MRSATVLAALAAAVGCGSNSDDPPEFQIVAVTFNTGTTTGLGHDDPPDDGYSQADAEISDMYYGDGLAWLPAVDATREFFAELRPDVVVFQEIFFAGECENIPVEAYPGFYCETWTPSDPTVANLVLGPDYQVACNLGKPDKCAAVRRDLGQFRGCDADLCIDGLDGGEVDGCGSGSRVGRGVIELAEGGELTLVNVHGSSGLTRDDMDCRVRQFDQVFVDLGDGEPAANGAVNLVMGDLNTDPMRLVDGDPSAARFAEFAGDGKPFAFATGSNDVPSYAGVFDIDHVVSDRLTGDCEVVGNGDDPPVIDATYFDHKPVVCTIGGDQP